VESAVFVDCAHRAYAIALVVFSSGLFGREGEAAKVPLEGGRWFEHIGDTCSLLLFTADFLLCESIVFGMARRRQSLRSLRGGAAQVPSVNLRPAFRKSSYQDLCPLEFARRRNSTADNRRYASPNFQRLGPKLKASQSQTCRSRTPKSAKASPRCLLHCLPRAQRPRQSPAKSTRRVGCVCAPETAPR
jgi:hypothetical protein